MIQIRNRYNAETTKPEKFTRPCLTVPNMTLPLKTLLDKYVRGESVYKSDMQYTGDNQEFANLERLDAQDKLEVARQIRESITTTQKNKRKAEEPQQPAAEGGETQQ